MSTPFPWLIEERLGDGQLIVRCAELEGGCGEMLEVAPRPKGCACAGPEYLAFYRAHRSCNESAIAEIDRHREEVRVQHQQESEANTVRLAARLRENTIREAVFSARDAHLIWKDLARLGCTDAVLDFNLRKCMERGSTLAFRGTCAPAQWEGKPDPYILFDSGERLEGQALRVAVRQALRFFSVDTPSASEKLKHALQLVEGAA